MLFKYNKQILKKFIVQYFLRENPLEFDLQTELISVSDYNTLRNPQYILVQTVSYPKALK